MSNPRALFRYRRWLRCWAIVVFALSLAGGEPTTGRAPRITRIDPPNWWIGMPQPMLMFTGENLEHARVSTRAPGIRIRRTMQGRNGHYLLAWLEIDKSAAPGDIPLIVATAQGRQTLGWRLDRRNPDGEKPGTRGRQGFNGFGPDDVIYLIMPDRFAD